MNKEKNYYEGQKMEYRSTNGTATLTIIRIFPMLCPPNGQNEIFRERKAYLCLFRNLPFKNEDGTFSTISGYVILGDDPRGKLTDWVESSPEKIDETWNESDLFGKTPEEAIELKVKNMEEIWQWTSLRTRCQTCKTKGEQCKGQLRSLINKTSFSFFSFEFEKLFAASKENQYILDSCS